VKDAYKAVTIDRFEGLNTGPHGSIKDSELAVCDNFLHTDEYKLEKIPGNVLLSGKMEDGKLWARDDTQHDGYRVMSDLRSCFRHVSGTKVFAVIYDGRFAIYERRTAVTAHGEILDFVDIPVPAGLRIASDDHYVSWESFQKNLYLAVSRSMMYYSTADRSLHDLNAENLAEYIELGGDTDAYTPLTFNEIATWKNRLFAAIHKEFPNIIAFTQPFKNIFYDIVGGVPKLLFVSAGGTDENSGDTGDKIERISPVGDNLVYWKNNSMGAIIGTGLLDFRTIVINTKVGLSARGSLQVTKIGAIWLHNARSGFWLWSGSGAPQYISAPVKEEVEQIQKLDEVCSGVWENKYYLVSYHNAQNATPGNNATLCLNLNTLKWTRFDWGFEAACDWLEPSTGQFNMIRGDLVTMFGNGVKDLANPDFTGGADIIARFQTKDFNASNPLTKKRWRGISLGFRTTDKALNVDLLLDNKYSRSRRIKTDPSPLWDRVKWDYFKWYNFPQYEKEVPCPLFSKAYRLAVKVTSGSVGRDFIDSIAAIYTDSTDSRGGKK